MAHLTEAACLLDAGVIYGSRLLLKPVEGDPVFVGFKAGAFSIYHGDAPIFHFDLEGRWQRVYLNGIHYLKGLDTTVRSIDRVREGESLVLKRRTLSQGEANALDNFVLASSAELAAGLASGQWERIEPSSKGRPLPTDDLVEMLARIARWDAAGWPAHRDRYRDTYGPLPLLPPDCTAPVVLQATRGDELGRTFGGRVASEFRALTPGEFGAHARSVSALLGRRVAQCRQIVLAGADVLRRPVADVAAFLETTVGLFPIEPGAGPRRLDTGPDAKTRPDGVRAVLDRLEGPLPSLADWQRLHSLGLTHVTLGVESADPSVRALYGKTWANDDLVRAVDALKSAGIVVGVLLLTGAGGVAHDAEVEGAAALISTLNLGKGDLVSLVDSADLRGQDGPQGVEPLGPGAAAQRLAELRHRLTRTRDRGAKVAPYLIDKQGTV